MPASSHKDNSQSANVKALFIALRMYGYLTSANENVAHIFTNTAN